MIYLSTHKPVPPCIINTLNNRTTKIFGHPNITIASYNHLRFMRIQPDAFWLQYNKNSKKADIITIKLYPSLEKVNFYTNFIIHLSNDIWFKRIRTLNDKYNKLQLEYEQLNQSSSDSLTDERSIWEKVQFLTRTPPSITELIHSSKALHNYKFNEKDNIRILGEDPHYLQYNLITKETKLIGHKNYVPTYIHHIGNYITKYLNLVKNDYWWYSINKLYHQEQQITKSKDQLCHNLINIK